MSAKIAINTRYLIKNKMDGIGWFTYETLRRIVRNQPKVDFYFIFDRKPDTSFLFESNVHPVSLWPPARHPALYYVWYEHSLKRFLNKLQPDLFVSMDGIACLGAKCKTLAVIHDLNFLHHPDHLPFLWGKYYNYFFPKSAKKADRIATVSNFSKEDIAQSYGAARENIDVVYNGVNLLYSPIEDVEKKAVRNKFSERKPYFLFIGTLLPRKNIARLLQAFNLFKQRDQGDYQLLLVGNKKFWTAEMQQAWQKMRFKSDVHFVGRLEPEELRLVLGAASALTFVPYFEGFGIPILEAMVAGVPVITSNVTSMPEVAADAALLVNPFEVESIANGMLKLSESPDLQNNLSEKGLKRVKDFSWERTAELLWQSMCKTLG